MSDSPTHTEPEARKKKSGSQTRDRSARVILCANAKEKADIEARAAKAGLSVSGYLRALVFGEEVSQPRAARRPPVGKETLARLLGELGKIGSNINQLAHHANRGKGVEVGIFADLAAELRATNRAILETLGKEPPKSKGELMDKLFKKGRKSP